MSSTFLLSLAAVVAAIVGARSLFGALPLRRVAVALRVTDAGLVGVGLVGLAFHCGAMFFRSTVQPLPGADTVISQIDALKTVSMIWFAVPAALLPLGLRRQHPIALIVVTLALVAVGVTMYDAGPLSMHLTAIFIAVVVLAGVAAAMILPPRRPSRVPPQH